MTTLDDRLLPKVLAIIDRVGLDVTLTDDVRGYSAATGGTSGIPGFVSIKMSPPNSPGFGLRKQSFADDLIEQGDTLAFIAASAIVATPPGVPKAGYTITLPNTDVWAIVAVEPIYSGEAIAAYEMLLRR